MADDDDRKKGYDKMVKSNFRVVQTCSRKYNHYTLVQGANQKKIKSIR